MIGARGTSEETARNGEETRGLRVCTSCRIRERRAGQRTCAECHAAYQKNYRGVALRRLEDRFYRKGFEAFRAAAVEKFRALPERSEFNGLVAAEIVRQIPSGQ